METFGFGDQRREKVSNCTEGGGRIKEERGGGSELPTTGFALFCDGLIVAMFRTHA